MGRVLLLNATFEPLQLVSERRAVVLMLAGRAEPIATPEDPSFCRSAMLVVEIPRSFVSTRWSNFPPRCALHRSLVVRCSCAIATSAPTASNTPTLLTTWCQRVAEVDTNGRTSSRRVGGTTCKKVIGCSRSWGGGFTLNRVRRTAHGGGGAMCLTLTRSGLPFFLEPRDA